MPTKHTRIPRPRLVLLATPCIAIVYLEYSRPFEAFRLGTFLLSFFLLANLLILTRGRVRDSLLFLSSIALGLSIVEAVLLFILAPQPILTTTPRLNAAVSVMGWGPKSPGRYHLKKTYAYTGKTIYDVVYTIDSNLLRETKSCDTCATIAFLGDSYTFGEGLNDADTLPQIFADSVNRKMRVLNLGYSGYGPQQVFREMQTGRFDDLIGRDPKFFVFLTVPWHAERSSCKSFWVQNGPRYILENNKVVFKGLCSQGPPLQLQEWLKAIHTPHSIVTFLDPFLQRPNHADMELYIRLVLAAAHFAKEKYGAPMIILFMNASNSYLSGTGFTNEKIVERLKDGGAIVVDADLAREEAVPGAKKKLRIVGDGHPTGLANRLRAAILKDYIAQHYPAFLPPQVVQTKAQPHSTF